jgi:hypothetical protein
MLPRERGSQQRRVISRRQRLGELHEAHRQHPSCLDFPIGADRCEFRRLCSFPCGSQYDPDRAHRLIGKRQHDVAGREPLHVFLGLAARLAFTGFVGEPEKGALNLMADCMWVIDPPDTCAHASTT